MRDFDELINRVRNSKNQKKVAVAVAEDGHTLEAVSKAQREGLVYPILVGNKESIKQVKAKIGWDYDAEIVHVDDIDDVPAKAVELVNSGYADFIMKGRLDTAKILKAAVNKEKGLQTGSLMSHIGFALIPTYHKLLVVTDSAMIPYPTLEQKKELIQNAVNTMIKMGFSEPKVAVLAAIEKVNPKMKETVEAAELKRMNQEGIIKNCYVEGPISYDCAMNKESASIKGYLSPVTGDVDLLLVPDLAAGNILIKSLIYSAGARTAGFIIGAKVPIVLTSRGATADEKYLSLVLSAASV